MVMETEPTASDDTLVADSLDSMQYGHAAARYANPMEISVIAPAHTHLQEVSSEGGASPMDEDSAAVDGWPSPLHHHPLLHEQPPAHHLHQEDNPNRHSHHGGTHEPHQQGHPHRQMLAPPPQIPPLQALSPHEVYQPIDPQIINQSASSLSSAATVHHRHLPAMQPIHHQAHGSLSGFATPSSHQQARPLPSTSASDNDASGDDHVGHDNDDDDTFQSLIQAAADADADAELDLDGTHGNSKAAHNMSATVVMDREIDMLLDAGGGQASGGSVSSRGGRSRGSVGGAGDGGG